MPRILVVAHKTLGGAHLLEEVQRRATEGTSFHLVVPVWHPHDHGWSDGEIEANAQRVLDEGIAKFKQHGIDATGEIGDSNPVYAVNSVVNRGETFDEIILSTLPPGPSRWLKLDAPSRLHKEFRVPVTHVVAERETVS